jgi:hypothetical protein
MNYPKSIEEVIEHIKSDNAYSLEQAYKSFNWKDEFFQYYSDFISLSQRNNSVDSLNFLSGNNFLNYIKIDSEIMDAVNNAISDNQKDWLKTFLDNITEQEELFPRYKAVYEEHKNYIWANISGDSLGKCNDEIFELLWNTSIEHANKLYPHAIIGSVLNSDNVGKIEKIVELCEKDNIDPTVHNIFDKCLAYEQFHLLDKVVKTYDYEPNEEDLKSSLITTGIVGSKKSLDYLLDKFDIQLTDNYEYGGLLVESAIRGRRFEFLTELVKKTYEITFKNDDVKVKKDCWFYSKDPVINAYYLSQRGTIWEDMECSDNNQNISDITKILELIKTHEPEHVDNFFKELENSAYPKLAVIAKSIDLRDKISAELSDNKTEKSKLKI